MARHFGTHHTQLTVRPGVWSYIESIVRQFDEPFADASAIPTYCLSRLTRDHVTVALSGDGGDELFAGYDRYRHFFGKRVLYRIPKVIRRPAAALSSLLPWGTRGKRFLRTLTLDPFDDYVRGGMELWPTELLSAEFLASLESADPMEAAAGPIPAADLPHELDVLCVHDIETYLPGDILTKVDRMSMAVSLEVRVPLLDHRVAEFAGTLPPSMRLRRGTGKYLLKRLLERYLPSEMVHRPKRGFGVPLGRWFRHELREALLDTLTPERIRSVGIFRPCAAKFLVDQHLSGQRDQSSLLWRLFVFHLWERLRHDQPARPGTLPEIPAAVART